MSGVTPQDRVGFIGKNIPEYFTLIYGAAKVNAVTVAVNWRLRHPRWRTSSTTPRPRWWSSKAEFLDHLAKMELPSNPLIIVVVATATNVSYTDWIDGRVDRRSELPDRTR